jgi:hypothetical protein
MGALEASWCAWCVSSRVNLVLWGYMCYAGSLGLSKDLLLILSLVEISVSNPAELQPNQESR